MEDKLRQQILAGTMLIMAAVILRQVVSAGGTMKWIGLALEVVGVVIVIIAVFANSKKK